MKALIYHGPGKKNYETAPRPTLLDATDAIVRITKTTICGTDLHILKGDLPTVAAGRILGHEGIGVVEETGAGVCLSLERLWSQNITITTRLVDAVTTPLLLQTVLWPANSSPCPSSRIASNSMRSCRPTHLRPRRPGARPQGHFDQRIARRPTSPE